MSIRPVKIYDLVAVSGLVDEMRVNTTHPVPSVDRGLVVETLSGMLANGYGCGFVSECQGLTGVVFGTVSPDWVSGDITASVMVWYTRPDENRGLELFRRFKSEASARGAVRFFAAAPLGPNYDRMCRIFKGMGMSPVETWFTKGVE